MINLEIEKTLALDAQERYNIISFAMDAADDNGFINSFIFERALYCFAAINLYPEHKDTLVKAMQISPIETLKTLIENDFIDKMIKEYGSTLDQLAAEAKIWFDEYSDWAHSARGILDIIQQFSGDVLQNAAGRLTTTVQETGVDNLLEIADEWGMNRDALKDRTEEEPDLEDQESLFE